ncbi:MAG: hypothetical protein LIP08_01380 [Bacteroides sp.]|nr:hypothetical protein [Bacteroides sp.]
MKTNGLSTFQLSKEEMKKVTGGSDYRCYCTQGVGSFTVSNPQGHDGVRLGELLTEYCANGAGECYKTK